MTCLLRIPALCALCAATFCLALPHSDAGVWIEFQLDEPFPGKPSPDGAGPWASARFEDTGVNEVTLTLKTFLAAGNKIQGNNKQLGWTFNIVEEKESLLGDLKIDFLSSSTGADKGAWDVDADAFKADGVGGKFDILFYWKGDKNALKGNDVLTYKLSGISGLTALDFNARSESKQHGDTIYKTAAKVQGIGDDSEGSTFIGASSFQVAPEPQTYVVWSLLAVMGGVISRRRSRVA